MISSVLNTAFSMCLMVYFISTTCGKVMSSVCRKRKKCVKKRRGEENGKKSINVFRGTTSCCVFDVDAARRGIESSVEAVPLLRWVGKVAKPR